MQSDQKSRQRPTDLKKEQVMHDLLLRRLCQYVDLSSIEMTAIAKLVSGRPRHVAARCRLLQEGDALGSIFYLLNGWICAYKLLEDGRCQNLLFFLPGDLWGFSAPLNSRTAYALRTVKDAIVIDIPRDGFLEVIARHPGLTEAFRWSGLVTDEISRERVLSLGQRTAKERCAHMICEIFWRLRAVGEVDGTSMYFPCTQEEIGNTIGVSTVHANRMLQDLRAEKLICQHQQKLEILDLEGLQRLAYFDSDFLHLRSLDPPPAELRSFGKPLGLGPSRFSESDRADARRTVNA